MARPFSEALGVSKSSLESLGAYDGFVDVDTKLYVDPFLLAKTKVPELRAAHKTFLAHFKKVFVLLTQSKRKGDLMWGTAQNLFLAKEIRSTGLGYGKRTIGNAIGPRLAKDLTVTASQILDAGINDPAVFELVGLFQEGIGADRISDMSVAVTLRQFEAYNKRLAKKLGVKLRTALINMEVYQFPFDPATNRPIVLVPKSILSDLPVAASYQDIDWVTAHNAALRYKLNSLIGAKWREAFKKMGKAGFRNLLLRNPTLFRELVDSFQRGAEPYDFDNDPAGEAGFYDVAKELAGTYPLDLSGLRAATAENLVKLVRELSTHFKRLVEKNGQWELLYNEGKPLKHKKERAAQRLFFLHASAYLKNNDIDISPEANGGAGPVDFKFSHGKVKVILEAKLSSNNLKRGYRNQIRKYEEAESAIHAFYLIARVDKKDEHAKKIADVQAMRSAEQSATGQAPEIIVVDARIQKSASKF